MIKSWTGAWTAAFVLFTAAGAVFADEAAQQHKLDLQERCAAQAKKFFKDDGNDAAQGDTYQSHYSGSLERCLVYTETTRYSPVTTYPFTGKYVFDAYEGRAFASYSWAAVPNKISICELALIDQEKKFCRTEAEFQVFVRQLMDH